MIHQEDVTQAVHDVGSGTAVLIDVRRDEEWNDLRAEGAMHWPLSRLENGELPEIPHDSKIYVHCAGGTRAEAAREILIAHGFADVTNIGGLKDWQAAGGEIE